MEEHVSGCRARRWQACAIDVERGYCSIKVWWSDVSCGWTTMFSGQM